MTLLLTLKIFFSVDIRFWKTPSRITFKNLGSFQGKYLWRSFVLVKLLSLRFTVVLTMISKIMILRNFIMILFPVNVNCFHFNYSYNKKRQNLVFL